MAHLSWLFFDAGWRCPPEIRFNWYETHYMRARDEYLEVTEIDDNQDTLGILKEPKMNPKPVMVGPKGPDEEGYIWVADVEDGEWVALRKNESKVWARPVVIKGHTGRRRKIYH